MSTAVILCLAMALDAIFGEPRWLWDRLPHPAVLMGKAVGYADQKLNRGQGRKAKGILTVVLLTTGALLLGWTLSRMGWVIEALVLAVLLAQKSLVDHVRDVANALRLSTSDGRRAVARIVGRDTATMDTSAVARSAIESGAENFSDGVIAPAFWFLIAGLPGLLLYKVINTADSMIGYRTERYAAFGWAAARFDDVLNIIPARLSAFLIALAHGRTDAWSGIRTEAPLHRSPNAGWPEAAMARVLGVALSGPRSYDGELRDFPFVYSSGKKDIDASNVDAACTVLWRTWALALAVLLTLAIVFGRVTP